MYSAGIRQKAELHKQKNEFPSVFHFSIQIVRCKNEKLTAVTNIELQMVS